MNGESKLYTARLFSFDFPIRIFCDIVGTVEHDKVSTPFTYTLVPEDCTVSVICIQTFVVYPADGQSLEVQPFAKTPTVKTPKFKLPPT